MRIGVKVPGVPVYMSTSTRRRRNSGGGCLGWFAVLIVICGLIKFWFIVAPVVGVLLLVYGIRRLQVQRYQKRLAAQKTDPQTDEALARLRQISETQQAAYQGQHRASEPRRAS